MMYNTPARFSQLSFDELYVLKRAFLESSYVFFMLGKYEKEEQKIHTALSNEIIGSIKAKGGNPLGKRKYRQTLLQREGIQSLPELLL